MTTTALLAPSEATWAELRSPAFAELIPAIIECTTPSGIDLCGITHLRTAHYAVYRGETRDGSSWIVRVGVVSDQDDALADNTGYLGTAAVQPTGQGREKQIAHGFAAAGAVVSTPSHHVQSGSFDVLWAPFLHGTDTPITGSQWHQALNALYAYRPGHELPVFTNRAKSFARLDQVPDHLTIALRNRYDTWLEALFESATAWSVVHGDAHAGNALNIGGQAVLFDFDTSCWAPSVWDITHLLNRAGTKANTGYTAKELASLFPFTSTEVEAALELRKVAAEIARIRREHTARTRHGQRT